MLRDESGYTLVETLIANALFLAALIPAILIFGRVTMNNSAAEKIAAYEIAKEQIEIVNHSEQPKSEQAQIRVNNKDWLVKTQALNINGLWQITVSVYRPKKDKAIAKLQTLRFQPFPG